MHFHSLRSKVSLENVALPAENTFGPRTPNRKTAENPVQTDVHVTRSSETHLHEKVTVYPKCAKCSSAFSKNTSTHALSLTQL